MLDEHPTCPECDAPLHRVPRGVTCTRCGALAALAAVLTLAVVGAR